MKRLTEKDAKPCPVCGGGATVWRSDYFRVWLVACGEMECIGLDNLKSKTAAIKLWNSIKIEE